MASTKPRILIITDWFSPGFKAGGPIQSVVRLTEQLHDSLDIRILTRDRDLHETVSYDSIIRDSWTRQEGFQVAYLSAAEERNFIQKTIQEKSFDLVYLNSFFSAVYALYPLFVLWKTGQLHKVILAPRGMLGQGALKLKSAKKKLFITLFKLLGMHRKIRFHSTDISETKDIKLVFGNVVKISEISNFPVAVSDKVLASKPDKAKFLFASRISPKKNLKLILMSLSHDMKFSVYGASDDPLYEQECRKIASKNVDFKGVVEPSLLMDVFLDHHFFVLPTLNENFGHAIIEALACGCPVIISDQTPWNDLQEFGAGWVISLKDELRWKEILHLANDLSADEYQSMSSRAKKYVKSKFNFDELRQQYKQLFSA